MCATVRSWWSLLGSNSSQEGPWSHPWVFHEVPSWAERIPVAPSGSAHSKQFQFLMEPAQGVKFLQLVQLKGMHFLIGPPIGGIFIFFIFHSLHYALAAAVPPGTSLEKVELS